MRTVAAPSPFGDLLRRLRLAAGLTQEALGARAGMSERGVQNLERGVRRPRRDSIRRLAGALGLAGEVRARFEAAADGQPRGGSAPGAGRSWAASARRTIPVPLTSFVGRERECRDVLALLPAARLLTLTGAGGCGKTRLAVRVAAEAQVSYRDGVWFVNFAPLADPALVAQTVATALGVPEQPGVAPLDVLGTALQSRDLLLVLDNCEHLVAACAGLAQSLLVRCAGVRVLATSREPLGLGGEVVWRVPSLATPPLKPEPSAQDVLAFDAVRLFVARAEGALPGFALDQAGEEIVARVCHQLDGLPLAIELAAAWVRVLSLPHLADRLGGRPDLLSGGSRAALPRHQTLRATIDWSHDLLSAAERTMFRRLAVFAGGWTLEAVEQVCPGPSGVDRFGDVDAGGVLAALRGLVEKSLVTVEARGTPGREYVEEPRYRLLETIRGYAVEKLEEAGETTAWRHRHLDWCARLAERAEPALLGADQLRWLDRLEGERDNLRTAILWSSRTAGSHDEVGLGLRLAGASWRLWFMRIHLFEVGSYLETLFAQADAIAEAPGRDTTGLRRALGRAMRVAGSIASLQADAERSRPLLERSLAIARELDDAPGVAYALNWLGWLELRDGPSAAVIDFLEQGVSAARGLPDRYLTFEPTYGLGFVAQLRGDVEAARLRYGESIALCQAQGDRWYAASPLRRLGVLEAGEGNLELARSCVEESLAGWRMVDDQLRIQLALEDLAYVERYLGHHERARACREEVLAIARGLGNRPDLASLLVRLGAGLAASGDHDTARSYLRESLELVDSFDYFDIPEDRPRWLEGASILGTASAHIEAGVRLAGAADAMRRARKVALPPVERPDRDRRLADARRALGDRAFDEAWSAGQTMSWDAANELAAMVVTST